MSKEFLGELFDQSTKNDYSIRFRDLRVTDVVLRQRLTSIIDEILAHGPILMGPRVEKFESRIAEYCGRRYGVGVSSGTDALYLALRAYNLGDGDEIVTTPMSWIATLSAILMTGAKPIFVDVREDQNIDPDKLTAAITENTKAIVPVHFTGRLCDMDMICDIARHYNLLVIEDAAQAMGAQSGQDKAGSFGDAAVFSLNPMKVFPGYGEAGAIVIDDPKIHEKLHTLRYLGTQRKEICTEIALNYKMDEIQAALLLTGFDLIDKIIDRRLEMARHYSKRLTDIITCAPVSTTEDRSSNYFDYVIFSDDRDKLRAHLDNRGIETKVKHPVLLCDHPGFLFKPRPEIPVADSLVKRMISLPLHDKMSFSDIDYVCDAIGEFQYCG